MRQLTVANRRDGSISAPRFKNGVADPPPITAALARNVRDRDGPGTGSRTAANIIHVRSPCALRPFDGFVIGEQIERHVLSDGNQRSPSEDRHLAH
jgi:hypothetical protein